MKPFMNDDFLLTNETAKTLYHDYAKNMPIYDYHCHLSPKEIAENKKYENITQVWLGGDHYKWRVLRSNGIDEKYITGEASDKEKFLKWAETLPYAIGNPVYHWSHLELKRYFGIEETLNINTAEAIWEKCNELLQKDEFSARELIKRSNVKIVCTTDDPIDDLKYHIQLKEEGFEVKVLPAFRPDKAINIDKEGFIEWIKKLEEVVGFELSSVTELKKALENRIEFFNEVGCKISDHALQELVYINGSEEEVDAIFKKKLQNIELTDDEVAIYKSNILTFLGEQYNEYGWTFQLHMGTIRNNNSKMFEKLGPDTGFDSVGDWSYGEGLSLLLDSLDKNNKLPKTILYCLNPKDNYVLGTMLGCFQSSEVAGKIQFGSGWWFNDHIDGMTKQMIDLANLGLLSRFVGMLTDSRSFLSYTRHEYFRRILCNLIGTWVENGEYPNDLDVLGQIVEDICFNNAKNYFGIEL